MSNFIHHAQYHVSLSLVTPKDFHWLGLVLKKLKPQNRSQFDFPKFLKNKQERGKTLGVISFSFIYDHDREDSKKINK